MSQLTVREAGVDKNRIIKLALMVALAALLSVGLLGLVACSSDSGKNNSSSSTSPAASETSAEASSNDSGTKDDAASEQVAPVDKSELNALIEQCATLDASSYTKDSFKDFEAYLKEAQKVAEDEGQTQNQVDAAVVNLQHKVESLEEKFDPKNYKSIGYEKIARYPDDYTGAKIKFSGNVLQVIEGDDENMIRLGTKDTYDDVVVVGYAPDLLKERILENDQVTVYGECVGLYSYEATLGQTITLPAMYATRITIDN